MTKKPEVEGVLPKLERANMLLDRFTTLPDGRVGLESDDFVEIKKLLIQATAELDEITKTMVAQIIRGK